MDKCCAEVSRRELDAHAAGFVLFCFVLFSASSAKDPCEPRRPRSMVGQNWLVNCFVTDFQDKLQPCTCAHHTSANHISALSTDLDRHRLSKSDRHRLSKSNEFFDEVDVDRTGFEAVHDGTNHAILWLGCGQIGVTISVDVSVDGTRIGARCSDTHISTRVRRDSCEYVREGPIFVFVGRPILRGHGRCSRRRVRMCLFLGGFRRHPLVEIRLELFGASGRSFP